MVPDVVLDTVRGTAQQTRQPVNSLGDGRWGRCSSNYTRERASSTAMESKAKWWSRTGFYSREMVRKGLWSVLSRDLKEVRMQTPLQWDPFSSYLTNCSDIHCTPQNLCPHPRRDLLWNQPLRVRPGSLMECSDVIATFSAQMQSRPSLKFMAIRFLYTVHATSRGFMPPELTVKMASWGPTEWLYHSPYPPDHRVAESHFTWDCQGLALSLAQSEESINT